jgi:hypothetical protein
MAAYEDTDDGWRIVYVPDDIMTSYYRALPDAPLFQNPMEIVGHAFYRTDECSHNSIKSYGFDLPGCYGTGVWNASTISEWPPVLYLGGALNSDYYNPVVSGNDYWGYAEFMVFENWDPNTLINQTPANKANWPATGWQTTSYYPINDNGYIPPNNGFQFYCAQGPITVKFVDSSTYQRQWCTGARGVFQRSRVDGNFGPTSTRLEFLSPTDEVVDTYIIDGYEGTSASWTPHADAGILQTWPLTPLGWDGTPDWSRYNGSPVPSGRNAKSVGSVGFKYTGRCSGFRLSKMEARWYMASPVTMFLHEFGKRTVGEGPPQRINRRNDGLGVNDKSPRLRNLASSSVSSRQSSNRLPTSGSLYE